MVTREDMLRVLALQRLPASIVADTVPDRGPLGGLHTALKLTRTPYSLVVACDMPFLNADLLRHLLSLAPGCDIVAPVVKGLTEQLHTLYSRSCAAAVEQLMALGHSRVGELFNMVTAKYVPEDEMRRYDPQLRSFFNINTEADLEQAKILLEWQRLSSDGTQKVST